MARFLGGDLQEINVSHPTLGEFTFHPKSNESYTLDPGGFRSQDDANMITGSGEMIDQVNRVRWMFEGPVAVDFDSENETTNFANIAASPELGTWTFTHISGVIWRGRGKVVGDIQPDTNTAQMPLKIAGSGRLVKL